MTDPLTSKQREAVQLAYKKGWYNQPSEVSARTLAEELDITHPALLERLNGAEKKIIGQYVEDWAEYELESDQRP